MNELDGEVTDFEVISKGEDSFPYDEERYFDQDNFYPMNGEVVKYTAANAAQNTGDYFDQDNFYPADGIDPNEVTFDESVSVNDAEFSDAIGDAFRNVAKFYRNTTKAAADYMSPKERAERKKARSERRKAKTDEAKSRAALNRSLGQDKASDIALADALKSTATANTTKTGRKPMSTTTKVLIGVGIVAVIGTIAFFALRKKK